MFKILATIACVFAVGEALRCHIVSGGNLSIVDNSQPQECGIGSLTCVKIVDLTRGTYSKQCQSVNCTMNGVPNSAANCQNTSTLGLSSMMCCCYGDGCNSAEHTSIVNTIVGSLFAFATARSIFF
ncbi:unnamed protein product [Caenorhabditis bovis]|uniref:UPAR/Ly6 domain-containing protein n=1 Tax=Caenorhabditis bovis TaxID=2654633 RepID=A0A8S1EGJ2_9PELO|nr:unnamed protein product [Caenorhabditis bovis]